MLSALSGEGLAAPALRLAFASETIEKSEKSAQGIYNKGQVSRLFLPGWLVFKHLRRKQYFGVPIVFIPFLFAMLQDDTPICRPRARAFRPSQDALLKKRHPGMAGMPVPAINLRRVTRRRLLLG